VDVAVRLSEAVTAVNVYKPRYNRTFAIVVSACEIKGIYISPPKGKG
jgi:UTP:GlnB (protein PII) uridylyltransferase